MENEAYIQAYEAMRQLHKAALDVKKGNQYETLNIRNMLRFHINKVRECFNILKIPFAQVLLDVFDNDPPLTAKECHHGELEILFEVYRTRLQPLLSAFDLQPNIQQPIEAAMPHFATEGLPQKSMESQDAAVIGI